MSDEEKLHPKVQEIRFWTSETDPETGAFLDPLEVAKATHRLTLIAVDPDGIGHDISALADGPA